MKHPFLPELKEYHFNAVVEGAMQDNWKENFYKFTELDISQGISSITDQNYKFELIGITDFSKFISQNIDHGERYCLEGLLAWREGIVMPTSHPDMPFRLDRPRSIILLDGRVYRDKSLSENEYSSNLDNICTIAGAHLFNPGLQWLYRNYKENIKKN